MNAILGEAGSRAVEILQDDFADTATSELLERSGPDDALTDCDPYKSKWTVGLFFGFVTGNLRVERFLGTSGNAVKCQSL